MELKLIAYHGKKEVKKFYLNRVKAHEKADEIAKGFYWQDGRGCGVGCTIHGNNHGAYETELGIPRKLAKIEDGIFEGLPNDEAKLFPAKFLNAIKVGADLSQVADKFLHWLLVDKDDGIIKFARSKKSRAAIQAVGDLYARSIASEKITIEAWRQIRNAADDAYAYAAYAAAYAAGEAAQQAGDAAYAYAAAYAADDAAYAADDAYAYAAARQKAHSRQAEKLLELLKAAPVVKQAA